MTEAEFDDAPASSCSLRSQIHRAGTSGKTSRRSTNPAQPVVGVTWYEARAYCAWLCEQSGLTFRLPTEVEWEAAARGREGRRYAYGEAFDPLRCNVAGTHVGRPTPVGVFPEGNTPSGLADMTGNVGEWTSSLYGPPRPVPVFAYPYRATDGREDPDAPSDVLRIVRGGSWFEYEVDARCAVRFTKYVSSRDNACGLRLCVSSLDAAYLPPDGK